MGCMRAQTRPRFTLSSEKAVESGVRTYVTPRGNPSTGRHRGGTKPVGVGQGKHGASPTLDVDALPWYSGANTRVSVKHRPTFGEQFSVLRTCWKSEAPLTAHSLTLAFRGLHTPPLPALLCIAYVTNCTNAGDMTYFCCRIHDTRLWSSKQPKQVGNIPFYNAPCWPALSSSATKLTNELPMVLFCQWQWTYMWP